MSADNPLTALFRERFAAEPALFRAPGRVNLIGEHTDYNGGFVMPAAIGFYTTVAIAPRADGGFRVRSTNFPDEIEFDGAAVLRAAGAEPAGVHWGDYVRGVVRVLQTQGIPLRGADLLIDGGVPLGSGLSSSAALEVAVALALTATAGVDVEPMRLAQIGQEAENSHVGMRCGIMDQFASACGRAGHALLLDCRTLVHRLLPLESRLQAGGGGTVRLMICNTLARHQHAGGEYNVRREQCEAAVQVLAEHDPAIRSLRDVTSELLRSRGAELDDVIRRRCRHVVSENERVLAAAQALEKGDLAGFGTLMRASHRSLRDDYEVSCPELDEMVRLADGVEGVYGSRMTGGGFGGCTVSLVRADAVERFQSVVAEGYRRATGRAPEIYACASADGATRIGATGIGATGIGATGIGATGIGATGIGASGSTAMGASPP